MDESEKYVERRVVADRRTAHLHAEHLRDRIEVLAERIAESEDAVAEVYEESARLRPHAADRLHEGARMAREYAEKERSFARSRTQRSEGAGGRTAEGAPEGGPVVD